MASGICINGVLAVVTSRFNANQFNYNGIPRESHKISPPIRVVQRRCVRYWVRQPPSTVPSCAASPAAVLSVWSNISASIRNSKHELWQKKWEEHTAIIKRIVCGDLSSKFAALNLVISQCFRLPIFHFLEMELPNPVNLNSSTDSCNFKIRPFPGNELIENYANERYS